MGATPFGEGETEDHENIIDVSNYLGSDLLAKEDIVKSKRTSIVSFRNDPSFIPEEDNNILLESTGKRTPQGETGGGKLIDSHIQKSII